ncbi:MAG: phosphate acetyltransferase [Clostridiales bacterium]
MNFLEEVFKKAKSDIKTIVLPESTDKRTLKAASILTQHKIAKIILIGKRNNIINLSEDIDISEVEIIDTEKFNRIDEYTNDFYNLRKHKGLTFEEAKLKMLDPIYFSVMMVKKDEADGMVAGAVNSTSNTLRPALQILKTLPGTKTVSSFFIMVVPKCNYGHNGIFVFSDCGLVENPNADQLSEIAISSAKSFENIIDEQPKIAMLSYSTYGSAVSSLTEKVVNATKITRLKAPELDIDGEIQLDAAIVPAIAAAKAPESSIEGLANVLIFPDLNCGNIAYKLTQRLAKAEAYGPITQGIAKPVNDLSRGCSAEDIVGVAAITAVQAQLNVKNLLLK